MDYKVTWNKRVDKALAKVPSFISDKFIAWAMVVERVGITEVRKLSDYHDEPLKGTAVNQT